jgi:BlaI family penicillinase repressor
VAAIPKPTDAELAILQVLWADGPSTVRDVLGVLEQQRPTGYTTVLKLLQIMTDKGLVTRDTSQRTHIYSAHNSESHTQSQLIGELARRAFDGSSARLAMQALSNRRASREELSELRDLLDELEGSSG